MSTKPLEIPEAVKQAYALHSTVVQSGDEIAATAGISTEEFEAFVNDPASFAALETAALAAETDGSLHAVIARKARTNFLRTILAYSKSADVSEIPELDRVLARVIEQSDRMKLAENQYENLLTVSFTFGAEFLQTDIIESEPQFVEEVIAKSPKKAQPKALPTLTASDLTDICSLPCGQSKNEMPLVGGEE